MNPSLFNLTHAKAYQEQRIASSRRRSLKQWRAR
jgi:hypothetical protein